MNYLDRIIVLLQEVRDTQAAAIEQAALAVAAAIQADHLIYVFGASHAGMLAQEVFYRAGGLVPVNPILPGGLTTDVRPVTLTSKLERLPGFGAQIVSEYPITSGDVLIVHSVSGRNAAAVEVAQGGRVGRRVRHRRDLVGLFQRGAGACGRTASVVRGRRSCPG